MSEAFLKVLNMSIAAGWLILAAVVVRILLKKAPRWITCILWALVAVRLICPFSPESVLSLIPSTETVTTTTTEQNTVVPHLQSGIEAFDNVVNGFSGSREPINREPGVQKPVPAPEKVPGSTTGTEAVVPETAPVDLIAVFAVVWLVGMAAMLLYAVISYFRLKKSVFASVSLGDRVKACDEVRSPFILGTFRPTIYVPSSMSGDTLRCVVSHEKAHIRRLDHWWKPLGYLLLAVYWFNPLIWIAYVLLCRDIEMACDEKVIASMGESDRATYSQALLNVSFPRRNISVCPLAFGEVGIKERVKSVLNYKKPAFWVILIAVVACVVVAVCFLTSPMSDETSGESSEQSEASDETSADEPSDDPQTSDGDTSDEPWNTERDYAWYTTDAIRIDDIYADALNVDPTAEDPRVPIPLYKFDTKSELDAFKGETTESHGTEKGSEETPSFHSATAGYDDGFFEEHSLIVCYVRSGNFNIHYGINKITCDRQSFCVYIQQTNFPQISQPASRDWLVVIEVDKADIADCTKFDTVFVKIEWNADRKYAWYTTDADVVGDENLPANDLAASDGTDLKKPLYKFDTKSELDAFRRDYGKLLGTNRGSDQNPSFDSRTAGYDDDFFENYALIVCYVRTDAQWHSFRLFDDNVYCDRESLIVSIEATKDSGASSSERAGHFLVIEANKADIADCTLFGVEYLIQENTGSTDGSVDSDKKDDLVEPWDTDRTYSWYTTCANYVLDYDFLSKGLNPYHAAPLYKFDTKAELDAFKRDYGKLLGTNRGSNLNPSFDTRTSAYGNDFFEDYSLIVCYVRTGAAANSYRINRIYCDKQSFYLFVDELQYFGDDAYPDECVGHLVVIEVNKADIAGCKRFDSEIVNGIFRDADRKYAWYTTDADLFEEVLSGALNESLLSDGSVKHLPIYRLDTRSDLEAFAKEYERIFRDKFGDSLRPSLPFEIATYGDAYFENSSLLVCYFRTGSGSDSFRLKKAERNGQSLCMYVEQIPSSEEGTCDDTARFVVIEVKKAEIAGCTQFDAVFSTDRYTTAFVW